MSVQLRLDRKTWAAIIIATLLVLAGPLFLVASYVSSKLHERSEQVFYPATDNVVILPNGSTMLVKEKSVTRRVVDWLKLGPGGEQTMRIDNRNFAAGSATPTQDGWKNLVDFARVLKGYRGLKAMILFSPEHGNSSTLQLERSRAQTVHDELLRAGADDGQVAVAEEAFEAGHDPARDEGLRVVLIRRW